MGMWNRLDMDVQAEVFTKIIGHKTLDQVLEHPVVVEGYKRRVLDRHKDCHPDWMYMLAHSKDAKLFRQMHERELKLVYDPFRNVTRCYEKADGTLVLIDDHYDRATGGFDLIGVDLKAFDFDRCIATTTPRFDVDKVVILKAKGHVSNPDWVPGSAEPQCIPYGQAEVAWWVDSIDSI